jgi:hypothetical protein
LSYLVPYFSERTSMTLSAVALSGDIQTSARPFFMPAARIPAPSGCIWPRLCEKGFVSARILGAMSVLRSRNADRRRIGFLTAG